MGLFVPILRLLMLFLNVYESFKTLKPPIPSSRDPTRPSVRALTQRKRDMKGCLAVWLVWVSLALYERIVERFVSLFIPFYDEFKSLILVFLIVTRAKGAEPIYLHVIRPMIKPYTSTLDAILEVTLMVGDFILALSLSPLRLAMCLWRKRFGPAEDTEFEDESSESSISDTQSLQTTHNLNGSQTSLAARPPASRHSSSNLQSNSKYEFWKPSASSYDDEDDPDAGGDCTIRPPAARKGSGNHVDEWRQYEAFPAAYPSTPFHHDAHLPDPPPFIPPDIDEDEEDTPPQQDFRKSLLPPRQPLNPSRAGDLSDKNLPFGISPFLAAQAANPSDADDSMSTDDYEEEDDFDVTLRTPLRVARTLSPGPGPRPHPRLFVSPPSAASSEVSIPSQPSALTTADGISPMRSDIYSDSSSAPNESLVPVIGKKRSYPRTRPINARNRVRQVDDAGHSMEQDSSDAVDTSLSAHERLAREANSIQPILDVLHPLERGSSTSDTADDRSESSSSVGGNGAQPCGEKGQDEHMPPEEKRRKVERSTSLKAVKPTRPSFKKHSKPTSGPSSPRVAARVAARSTSYGTVQGQGIPVRKVPLQTRSESSHLSLAKKTGRIVSSASTSQESTESSSVGEGAVSLPPKPGSSRSAAKRKA